MENKIYMIDSLSPFFLKCGKTVTNWSKIPFDALSGSKKKVNRKFKKIIDRSTAYFRKVSNQGYTAVSIDDLAHLTLFDFYDEEFKKKIAVYRKFYRKIFTIAESYGLQIFINTDIMFFNAYIDSYCAGRRTKYRELLIQAIEDVCTDFRISGVIFRLGESDGVDVHGDFKSRVVITHPETLSEIIRELLPVFTAHEKYCIVRTWTLGAYPVGDLSFHEKTFFTAIDGIESDYFILSMKYADADFFRHLELNPFFFKTKCRTLLELQTRREYEGHGMYPSYTGGDYETFYTALKESPNFAGIHVWCQTGGWSPFNNRTFSRKSSLWNEINTISAIRIFKYGMTSTDAVKYIARDYLKIYDYRKLEDFLMLSDFAVKNLLYDPAFAANTLYINKVRIPPLLYVFWDTVSVNSFIVTCFRLFGGSHAASSDERGREALKAIEKMKSIAGELKLKYRFSFHYDTFELFYLIRRGIYYGFDEKSAEILKKKIRIYTDKYPAGYTFIIDYGFSEWRVPCKLLLRLFIRRNGRYRKIDKVIFSAPLRFVMRMILKMSGSRLTAVSGKRGMNPEFFLR